MQVSNFVPTVNEAAATYKGKYGSTVIGKFRGRALQWTVTDSLF